MERWARSRTCFQLRVISSPGPRQSGSCWGLWGEVSPVSAPPAPRSPARAPTSRSSPWAVPCAPVGFPAAASASPRRMWLLVENQPQMWLNRCCCSAVSRGSAWGHGDSRSDMLGGQDLGVRSSWRGLSLHQGARTGGSAPSAAAAPQGGVTGHPGVPPALGTVTELRSGATSTGLSKPWVFAIRA